MWVLPHYLSFIYLYYPGQCRSAKRKRLFYIARAHDSTLYRHKWNTVNLHILENNKLCINGNGDV